MITLTVETATKLLEHNTLNRPISDVHVQRIARQIAQGKWRFNGDTIKVSEDGDVLDGQHRLWAVIEAKKPVDTIIVYGIARDAFATIDTLRRMRSGADVLALNGVSRYRQPVCSALQWLLRWQRDVIETWRAPQNRIENADVEECYVAHPAIVNSVERTMRLRGLANPGVMAFLYYVFANHNEEIAERMISTLEDPSGVSVDDPFFRLRMYFTADHYRRKDPLTIIALTIKAANAAAAGKEIQLLAWRQQGQHPEAFPTLQF